MRRQPEAKPAQVTASICEALQRSYIFRGMPEQLLAEVRWTLTAATVTVESQSSQRACLW